MDSVCADFRVDARMLLIVNAGQPNVISADNLVRESDDAWLNIWA